MKYKIGFHGYEEEKKEDLQPLEIGENKPVKSVVQVRFPSQGRSVAYYNDRFDLHVGDIVFVEGKLEGVQGFVTEVSRSFKIKLSDYKRVISVADTTVKGELYFGGSHLIAFDKNVIPYEKVRGWFLPPESDEEVAVGYDDEGFFLDELGDFEIKPEIAKRGFDYYNHNKVVYISEQFAKPDQPEKPTVTKPLAKGHQQYVVVTGEGVRLRDAVPERVVHVRLLGERTRAGAGPPQDDVARGVVAGLRLAEARR